MKGWMMKAVFAAVGWGGVLMASMVTTPRADAAPDETLLLQQPTVSAEHVVFVYAGDLWIVSRDGGDARRLTSDVGIEQSPRLSPDGRHVAFSAQYEGNTDVYVISIEGGMPERLTWHPGSDLVRDWHPDGQHVLFSSSRYSDAPVRQLFLVPKDGGTPRALPVPRVAHAAYDRDASHIAYTPYADAFRTWKRYRGGRVARVWIYDTRTHDVEAVPHVNASDTFPCWLAGEVYYASDRDGQMNLWKFRPGTTTPQQITHFTDFDVRNMDAGGGVIAYEQAGAIHLYDPMKGESRRLHIRVRADGLHKRPRWQSVDRFVRASAIAPNGKRAVFEARGEILTLPYEHGDARNLTSSPGVHDRSPTWSPDGEKIAWFSDASGEYRLHIADRRGFEDAEAHDLGGVGFYYNPVWSPDGKHVLFQDKGNRVAFLTLETGDVTDVIHNQGSLGVLYTSAVWSPDSRWIAFEWRNPETSYDRVALYSLDDGSVTPITDGFAFASDPAFSKDGKHLFFAASVDVGPRLFGLDMNTSAVRDSGSNLYFAVLKKDGGNPLAPRSDEAVAEKKSKDEKGKEENGGKEKDAKKDEDDTEGSESADGSDASDASEGGGEEAEDSEGSEETPKESSIDLEGLDQRILALPLPAGRYGSLAGAHGGKLLYVERPRSGGSKLVSFDFDSRKSKTVSEGVGGFTVSADGKWILAGGRRPAIMDTNGGKKKTLDMSSVRVRVEPEHEWPQILREVWRIERDYFYDPNMHGVDWDAMWDRWSAFLPHVAHRADLNVIISELIGELACGHNYAGGGETPRPASGVATGLLGADLEPDGGRFRIAKIYRGQNWNPRLRAPLTEPGVDVNEGDFLIRVNGREVTTDANLYSVFENLSGKQVSITVAATPDGADARTSTVVPTGSDGSLRRLAWIEGNRRRVDELSGGRLAYVYMPNTGGAGLASFDRDFYSQVDKEGLVLDERFNGGGKVADYVMDVLSREVTSFWMNREGWLARSPFATLDGPKVMVINERAGSGGDWMPWAFQKLGIGKLVGRRTWGGLVGISGYPPLVDGGSVTAASFGVMDSDGTWAVENVGVAPDIEVTQWPKDVIAGRDPQLEKAVEIALAELEGRPAKERPKYYPPSER